MGHFCRYQLSDFENEEVKKALLKFLSTQNWDYIGDEEEFIVFDGSHKYSFDIHTEFQKHGIIGCFIIEVWYDEREADKTIRYNEASQ